MAALPHTSHRRLPKQEQTILAHDHPPLCALSHMHSCNALLTLLQFVEVILLICF